MHRILSVTICVLVLSFTAAISPVAALCLDGTIVATYQSYGPYRGLYLYTVTLNFLLEKGSVTLRSTLSSPNVSTTPVIRRFSSRTRPGSRPARSQTAP